MKTTLTKNITLHTATAYLTFEREVARPDIQEYLAGKHFNNELIEHRVQTYLKQIKLLDEKGQLTAKGHKAQETSKIFVQEEGKYKIWFTERDLHFGTKIFYFKRIQPYENERIKPLNIEFDKENHYFLPVKDATFSHLKLVQNEKILGNRDSGQEKIQVTWEWNELASSSYKFEGKIDKENNIQSVAIPTNENLENHILRILPDWDKVQNRAKMKHENVLQEAEKSFETTFTTTWRDFEVRIQQLPIMPYNVADAQAWRNSLLTMEAVKKYFSATDFQQMLVETNNKNGFASYKNELDTSTMQEYAQTLRNTDKATQSVAYWHLVAASDLSC